MSEKEHQIPAYMSPEYVRDKTSVDILWKQLQTLQELAKSFGIDNIFQDNGAEICQQLIYLNMKAVPGRNGNDGADINDCEWEMKSIDISKKNAGVTTNHHLNRSILEKYRVVPWSVSLYDGITLKEIYIIGPDQMKDQISAWEKKLNEKGVESLNNPKMSLTYVREHGICIYKQGDEYPIDPMTKMDTTKFLENQKEYFAAQELKKLAAKKQSKKTKK